VSPQQAKVSTATIWHFYTQCINLKEVFVRFIQSTASEIITETVSTPKRFISGSSGVSEALCSHPQEKGRTRDYISPCTLVRETHYFKSGKPKPTIQYILPISNFDLPGTSSILYTAGILNRSVSQP